MLYIPSVNKQVDACTFDSTRSTSAEASSAVSKMSLLVHMQDAALQYFLQHKVNLNHCLQFPRGTFCTPFNYVTLQRFKKCCSTLTVKNIWMCAVQVDDIFGPK